MLKPEEFKKLSKEEQKIEMLAGISDAVRDSVHKLMMMKAIAKHENDLSPENFDAALNRELKREWEKLKDKSEEEIAIIGLFDMAMDGAKIEEILQQGDA